MASTAQILANRENALSSTGPVTADGKSRCARNAVTMGLFTKGDIVLESEQDEYAQFFASHEADLLPIGAIEHTLAAEIIHASWRLRRCRFAAADIDPNAAPEARETQERSIDRARATAQRAWYRGIAELRRLQTERHIRAKLKPLPEGPAQLGVASCREIDSFRKLSASFDKVFLDEWISVNSRLSLRESPNEEISKQTQSAEVIVGDSAESATSENTKQSQFGYGQVVQTPRGAPCPCGSGNKYKRCCGKDAPAVLGRAA